MRHLYICHRRQETTFSFVRWLWSVCRPEPACGCGDVVNHAFLSEASIHVQVESTFAGIRSRSAAPFNDLPRGDSGRTGAPGHSDDVMKKALLVVASLCAALMALGFFLYLGNPAPAVPAISAVEAARTRKPYVVKLHAQWCPACMVTKGVWSRIEETYSGRANLVVLDFTNQASTQASKVEAARLGLERFFDEYGGATGTVVVLDGRTREVMASIGGSRDFGEYRAAIDAALERAARP
jgi:thiol-disulfide isomerase/thioredoxin